MVGPARETGAGGRERFGDREVTSGSRSNGITPLRRSTPGRPMGRPACNLPIGRCAEKDDVRRRPLEPRPPERFLPKPRAGMIPEP